MEKTQGQLSYIMEKAHTVLNYETALQHAKGTRRKHINQGNHSRKT